MPAGFLIVPREISRVGADKENPVVLVIPGLIHAERRIVHVLQGWRGVLVEVLDLKGLAPAAVLYF